MQTEHRLHLNQLFDERLLNYIAEMVYTPLQPTSCTVTATHCMCILSHLMQSYTSEYSLTLDNLFKNVVVWMDSEPNNKTLLVGAFSLLCAIQIDTRNNLINMAIIHAFSGLYKFAYDATILNQCVLFLYRASCDTLESRNVLRNTMQSKIELFMAAATLPDVPTDGNTTVSTTTPTMMQPTVFLLDLSCRDMPPHCGHLVHLIKTIIANIQQ